MVKEVPSMDDCATSRMRFETPAKLALEAAFDGGRLTSDGGLTWLAEVDKELGVCQAMAEHIPEWRSRRGRHSMLSLLKQRVYQIACGYEDQNDSNFLRSDPLLKLVCGALPESGEDLASQPTICRMENAVSARACYQMARALAELYIAQRGKDGAPEKIVLDFDATDDPTHGDQEQSYYHGYFKEHIYHPLLVFDGDTGQLISALLRAGNTHASRCTVALLKRLVGLLRSAWPGVEVELRADAGFAVPAVYDYCEAEGIRYTIALITNSRLEEMASSLLEEAQRRYEQQRGRKVRLLSQGHYQAGSWQIERRVVYKAEVMEEGTNTRFVVTNRPDEPDELYAHYTERGETENRIKDLKVALKADRLSCHRFVANQFRLLLHAAAYWLMDTLRKKLVDEGIERMQLDTLRLKLVKIGGRVRELLTKVRIHLASGHPGQYLWHALSGAFGVVHE
jgi:Transposase DDE domain group 1